MKGKKIKMYFIIIILILIILGIGYLTYININYEENNIQDVVPEQEITDEQLRQTVILLFFKDKNNNEIKQEARQIDSKKLLENPYKYLIELLIVGPDDQNLEKIIPESTTINNIEIRNGVIYLDLSHSFIEDETITVEEQKLIMDSILKTLNQLTEVKELKILIDGVENLGFAQGLDFSQNFK